jgi:hypothetical protein
MASLLSVTFEPVMLEHVQDHSFVKRAQKGCATCGRGKTHPEHHGFVPSVNVLGSGNQFAHQAMKQAWQKRWCELAERADLPRPCSRLLVEAEITFPDRRGRDQDNHRNMLAKSLGDAFVEGGWLEKDEFYPVSFFEFGNLTARYEKGVAATRLMIFATG